MSTSIILLDQNFNANDFYIIFELSVLFPPPPAAVWGEIDDIFRFFKIMLRELFSDLSFYKNCTFKNFQLQKIQSLPIAIVS